MPSIFSNALLNQLESRLNHNPEDHEALLALGMNACTQGNFLAGLEYMHRAVALRPQDWRYHYNLGSMYQSRHQLDRAAYHLRAATDVPGGGAEPWFALGELYASTGESVLAQHAYQHALAIDSQHMPTQNALDHLLRKQVKAWHFSMMNDSRRNVAYETAIAGQVSGKVVLEIGAGSGLLSMMAARAGAQHVYACEMVPLIAQKAREIIARNGLTDKITVFSKPSFDVTVGSDELPVKAQVLITETFDSHLIGENVLEIIADAKSRLLAEDAIIIPATGTVMAMMVESQELYQQANVTNVCGFDLSPFNEFKLKTGVVLNSQNYSFIPLCEPVEVVTFDFMDSQIKGKDSRMTMIPTQSGVCHGILSWIKLGMGQGMFYEVSPADQNEKPQLHWLHALQTWDEPFEVHTGCGVDIAVQYTPKQFLFAR